MPTATDSIATLIVNHYARVDNPLIQADKGMRLPNVDFWRGRTVLVTGHLGFKGRWLTEWLYVMGARVHGFDKRSTSSMAAVDREDSPPVTSTVGDITDYQVLSECFAQFRPDVVLHLAAQPLVRASYAEPAVTFRDNVQGTINVLEAVRASDASVCICVTSDKVYLNREPGKPFVEADPLGGWDPYSASKAASDIAVQSYAQSFFGPGVGQQRHPARVASVRAGNVIGGGDWAVDRLIPDAMRALHAGQPVEIRNPQSIRPWQHVLDPVCGYLLLAECAGQNDALEHTAWNFGPSPQEALTVADVMELVVDAWGSGSFRVRRAADGAHEAVWLTVDSSRAGSRLQWEPRWEASTAIRRTVEWYKAYYTGHRPSELMWADIESYLKCT